MKDQEQSNQLNQEKETIGNQSESEEVCLYQVSQK